MEDTRNQATPPAETGAPAGASGEENDTPTPEAETETSPLADALPKPDHAPAFDYLADTAEFEAQQAAPAASLPKKGWFKRHKRLRVLLIILVVAAAVFALYRFRTASVSASGAGYDYIRTTTLTNTSLRDSFTTTGTVASGDEASVTADNSVVNYAITEIMVAVGDEVEAGDVILKLDTSELEKQLESARKSYSDAVDTAQTNYDRQKSSYEVAVVQHDNDLIDAQNAIDDAQEAVDDAYEAEDQAQDTYNSAESNYNSINAAYQTAESQISAAREEYDAAAQALTDAQNALNDAQTAYLADTGNADLLAAYTAAQNTVTEAQNTCNNKSQALTNAQNNVSNVGLGLYGFNSIASALTQAQTALTQAQTTLDTAKNATEQAETQLTNAQKSYDSVKNATTLTTQSQGVEDAYTQLQQAIDNTDNITTIQENIEKCTLTATASGTVTSLNATVGSTCGNTAVATIQNLDALVVDVTVSEDYISQISTGLPCIITTDATGDTEISGTLTQIDPVANDQNTFGAEVTVSGDTAGLLVGIQAQVEVIIRETDNVFTVPIDAVGTAEDGSKYVLRQTGGEGLDMTFEEVPVTTGDSTDYSIIISGDDLAEGDVIRASANLDEGIVSSSEDDDAGNLPDGGDFTFSMGDDAIAGDMGAPGGDMGGGPGAPGGAPGGM